MAVNVYVLCDPRSDEVRYVGATSRDVSKRLSGHLAWAYQNRGRRLLHPRDAWLLDLRRQGLKPTVRIVETTTEADGPLAERHWIAHYRRLGADLTNHASGAFGREGATRPAAAATCTTIEAAEVLGVSRYRVWQLIQDGRLPATKNGRDWTIQRTDLVAIEEQPRRPGRPRKDDRNQRVAGQSLSTPDDAL